MKHFIPSVFLIFILLSCFQNANAQTTDSLQTDQFRRTALYVGFGFPLGVGGGFIYRPSEFVSFSAGLYKTLQFFYFTDRETILRFTISSPTNKINAENEQSGIIACFDFYLPEDVGPDTGPLGWTSGLALLYGSMPTSRSSFQWGVGVHLRFDTFIFYRSSNSIRMLPEFECSFLLF